MRQSVHTSLVQVRLPERLLAEAKDKAREEGMTLSELTRHALRREVKEAA